MANDYGAMIIYVARNHIVPEDLALAIAKTESSLNPFVAKHEPAYQYLFKPDYFVKYNNNIETEKMFQMTSFGLFQLMGANFREMGFSQEWGLVFNPETQVSFGVAFIKRLLTKYPIVNDAIAAYNAGSVVKKPDGTYRNQYYVESVLRNYPKT